MVRQQPRQETEASERQEAALIAAIAAAIAVGAPLTATTKKVAEAAKLPVEVVMPIMRLALARPFTYPGVVQGTASYEASQAEVRWRAAYILYGSRRVYTASRASTPILTAVRQEKVQYERHLHAMANRRESANAVDQARARFGTTLGWYATRDGRTTAECRTAHGKNFDAARPPAIGYPGAVHPFCRCKPGKPHARGGSVYNIRPEKRSAA